MIDFYKLRFYSSNLYNKMNTWQIIIIQKGQMDDKPITMDVQLRWFENSCTI